MYESPKLYTLLIPTTSMYDIFLSHPIAHWRSSFLSISGMQIAQSKTLKYYQAILYTIDANILCHSFTCYILGAKWHITNAQMPIVYETMPIFTFNYYQFIIQVLPIPLYTNLTGFTISEKKKLLIYERSQLLVQ